MFKLSVPLVPLASDGGGTTPPPVDRRPFKPGGDGDGRPPAPVRVPLPAPEPVPAEPQGERDPAIDAMVAQWLSEGWLYVHAPSGEYRNRRSRWREQTEEEKTWNA